MNAHSPALCDEITCGRCGTLAAYGWSENAIADALLLSLEQVRWAAETPEYKESFGKRSVERLQNAIDVADGWNAVEEKALASVIQALEYNRDPRFALQAARVANQAHRRIGGQGDRVINAQQVNTTIVLTLGEKFVQTKLQSDNRGVLDVKHREVKELPRRQADIPTPKTVQELLAPARENAKKIKGTSEYEGISFVMDDLDGN